MKRFFSISVLFFLVCISVFAEFSLPISVGFGLGTGYYNSGISAKRKIDGTGDKEVFSGSPYGFFTFFDIKYVQAGIGYSGISTKIKHSEELRSATGIDPEDVSLKGGMVNLSLSLKYPIQVGGSFLLFPLVSLEGDIYVSMNYAKSGGEWGAKAGYAYPQGTAGTWSSCWLQGGLGVDYFITESLFLRGVVTAGYKFSSSRELGIMKKLQDYADGTLSYKDVKYYGAGFKITLALGYSFEGFSGGRRGSRGNNVYYPRR